MDVYYYSDNISFFAVFLLLLKPYIQVEFDKEIFYAIANILMTNPFIKIEIDNISLMEKDP